MFNSFDHPYTFFLLQSIQNYIPVLINVTIYLFFNSCLFSSVCRLTFMPLKTLTYFYAACVTYLAFILK
jgi:hypothetical protein